MADAPDAAGKRIFTYGEAQALLPRVRALTQDYVQRTDKIREGVLGGSLSPETGQEQLQAAVDEWAQAASELGVQVKGLWLVDFDNGSGYYCWSHPEAGLEYFHSYDEGFSGRMRIQ
jgi:hypothetical protein